MGGASWVAGGAAAPVPYALPLRLPPSRREKKTICALSTVPVHCRSVNFM